MANGYQTIGPRRFGPNAWKLIAAICFCTGCQRAAQMAPLPPHFTAFAPGRVPVILVGEALQDAQTAAAPQRSEWDGRPVQLWKVRVRVEQVLQGDMPSKEADIFYFADMGTFESSDRPLRGGIYAGHSEIFFLQSDRGRFRTVCDGWRNCVLWVRTGSHFNFKIDPRLSIEDLIVRLLLSRGDHTTDKQMADSIDHPELRWGTAPAYDALLQLVTHEKSEAVRMAAREELRKLQQAYGAPRRETPQNL